jgi:hypothetical protein
VGGRRRIQPHAGTHRDAVDPGENIAAVERISYASA